MSQKESGIGRRTFFSSLLASAGLWAGVKIRKNFELPSVDPWEHPLPPLNPQATNFLLLGDIHAGISDLNPRQHNTRSIDALIDLVNHRRNDSFNYLIQLGDVIRETSDEALNIDLYNTCLHILKKFPYPALHLLGNHDLWGISPTNLDQIYKNLNSYYGVKEFDNFQMVWLDVAVAKRGAPGYLPKERLDWLHQTIYPDTPTLIFAHYSLKPETAQGNPYFENNPSLTAYQNGEAVLKRLHGLPVFAYINAHLHWGSYRHVNNTYLISIPAFVENNASSSPGTYSVLEVKDPNNFSLSTFFGSICSTNIS